MTRTRRTIWLTWLSLAKPLRTSRPLRLASWTNTQGSRPSWSRKDMTLFLTRCLLGLSNRGNDPLYQTLFKKLCCCDAIAGSYAVWTYRCRRHFCYLPKRYFLCGRGFTLIALLPLLSMSSERLHFLQVAGSAIFPLTCS